MPAPAQWRAPERVAPELRSGEVLIGRTREPAVRPMKSRLPSRETASTERPQAGGFVLPRKGWNKKQPIRPASPSAN
jgi:hypothetical protein